MLVLSGCTNDPLAEQYASGSGQGYISGDGAITEIPASQRDAPIVFSGVDETGATGRVMGWQLLSANVAELGLSAVVGIAVDRVGTGAAATVLAVLGVLGLPLLVASTGLHAADAAGLGDDVDQVPPSPLTAP